MIWIMAFLYAHCLASNSVACLLLSASCWAFVIIIFFALKDDRIFIFWPSGGLRHWALVLLESWTSPSVGYSPNVFRFFSTSCLVPDSRYRFKAFWKAVEKEASGNWHQKEFSAQTRSAETKKKQINYKLLEEKKDQTSNQLR